jgi:hypothetical protein
MKTTKVKASSKKEDKQVKQATELVKRMNKKYRNTMRKLAYE